MCGIFIWIKKAGRLDAAAAAAALATLNHRGPDHQAMLFHGPSGGQILPLAEVVAGRRGPEDARMVLGHARLSVIDLSAAANQPMVNGRGAGLVFNGTIYNYVELREELKRKGKIFHTQSDTEVLLEWLDMHGSAEMTSLNGSWAFAFHDPMRNRIEFARDPYGERPLFYYEDRENFIAASELKAIFHALGEPTRPLDATRVAAFVAYRNWSNVDPGRTLYPGFKRLAPGMRLSYDLASNTYSVHPTHDLAAKIETRPDPVGIAEDMLTATTLRLRADVPIGVTVSGGVDSSIIAALVCAARTSHNDIGFYTARFPDAGNEDFQYAKMLADDFGITLKEVPIDDGSRGLENLSLLTRQYDQPVPIAGGSISDFLMMRAMAQDGIRVAVSGMGGDEIFGGYGNEYIEGGVFEYLARGRLLKAFRFSLDAIGNGWTTWAAQAIFALKLTGLRNRSNSPLRHFMDCVNPRFAEAAERTDDHYWGKSAYRSSMSRVQLDDCLVGRLSGYVAFSDLNAMANSVEMRCPFLDPNLTPYMALAPDRKFKGPYNKYALREAMPASVRPEIRFRQGKQGFSFPFASFLHNNQTEIKDKILATNILREIFDLEKMLTRLRGHPLEIGMRLSLLSLAEFCDQHACTLVDDHN